jgi:hypothetical protein
VAFCRDGLKLKHRSLPRQRVSDVSHTGYFAIVKAKVSRSGVCKLRTSDLMPLMYKSDPEIGTEISRNRKGNRITENHRAWSTHSELAVYARTGLLAQPLQWARDDASANGSASVP